MKLPHHRKYLFGIFHSFPLIFPKHCVCCGYGVVRESMWKFEHGPWNGTKGVWRYLCKDCVPTLKLAHDYARQFERDGVLSKVTNTPFTPPKPPTNP